jgi:hypothetical protein
LPAAAKDFSIAGVIKALVLEGTAFSLFDFAARSAFRALIASFAALHGFLCVFQSVT